MTARIYSMAQDIVLGDGGNRTVYERPDGSRYALDKRGHGEEWGTDGPVFGRARFDARAIASGRWEGSRSSPEPLDTVDDQPRRARRRHAT